MHLFPLDRAPRPIKSLRAAMAWGDAHLRRRGAATRRVQVLCRPRPEVPGQFEWVDLAGPSPGVANGPLDELRAATRAKRWAVLYGSDATLLTRVAIKTSRRRLVEQSAPYAIEELLAGDVEQLQVAIGNTPDDGSYAVAATERAELAGLLARFGTEGEWPPHVLPETLALPWVEGEWTIALDGERLVVRSGACSGLAIPAAVLGDYLEVLTATGDGRPAAASIYGGDAPARAHVTAELARFGIPSPTQHADPYLLVCARGTAWGAALDFRTGSFAAPRRGPSRRSWWMGLGAVVLSALALNAISYLELRAMQARHGRLLARTGEVAAQLLPGGADPAQLQAALPRLLDAARARARTHEGSFLVMTGHLAAALATQEHFLLRQLRYENATVELELVGPDIAHFDRLRRQLAEVPSFAVRVADLSAPQQSRVIGRLLVTAGQS